MLLKWEPCMKSGGLKQVAIVSTSAFPASGLAGVLPYYFVRRKEKPDSSPFLVVPSSNNVVPACLCALCEMSIGSFSGPVTAPLCSFFGLRFSL